MPQDTFLITLTPRQLSSLRGWRATPALLTYRIGPGPHLYRADGGSMPKGALMVVDDREFDGLGRIGPLRQEILRECQLRGFQGAVLDFEGRLPPLGQLVAGLAGEFDRRGWQLYVPEHYASAAPQARVMISSALSGGALSQRLEEALGRFGADRVALALEKRTEDFTLPSPSGSGEPLTGEELKKLMERVNPSIFFSNDLCARYFTYMDRNGGAHFVLMDDRDTLRRKVEVARRAGVRHFLAPWAEVSDFAGALGLERVAAGGARTQSGPRT